MRVNLPHLYGVRIFIMRILLKKSGSGFNKIAPVSVLSHVIHKL